ncbi:GNAT family N-acetyltransferase [Aureimonas altamirensis]|uniref:GNAT family N-acetyltransferase n=1 Tax=Aureimonas altamirensis TaxID=370622 RepID=UPI001E33F503|nr:GNAT family N-acetyltransferase [Aureimonas altamirensis]UHD44111.1 GNAT family N-acetyltransferase [Aureimonas altamirensis]
MIETGRLILTEPPLADFDESFAMSSDAAVTEFIGGKPASREDAWNKVLRNIGHWKVFGFGIFTVREKASRGYVGEVGLAHFARGLGENFDPFPEAAWVLATGGHGKGYGTEAVVAAHDWMTQKHQPVRTVCIIHPDNAASIRLAEKLGYTSFGEAQYRGATPTMFERA